MGKRASYSNRVLEKTWGDGVITQVEEKYGGLGLDLVSASLLGKRWSVYQSNRRWFTRRSLFYIEAGQAQKNVSYRGV